MALFAAGFMPAATPTAISTPTEYAVKTAFLYKFLRFITWPDETLPSKAPLIICVAGKAPFGNRLKALEHKRYHNHPIRVMPWSPDVSNCHVLFVAEDAETALPSIRKALQPNPALIIGDRPTALDKGAMLAFYTEKGKIRFMVNRSAVQESGISISAHLLRLATFVNGTAHGETTP